MNSKLLNGLPELLSLSCWESATKERCQIGYPTWQRMTLGEVLEFRGLGCSRRDGVVLVLEGFCFLDAMMKFLFECK